MTFHPIIRMKFSLPLLCLLPSASAFILPQAEKVSTTSLWGRKPFISGNWKLNPQTRDEAVKLAADIAATVTPDSPDADVALFVPYVFIEAAQKSAGDRLFVGAEVSHLCRPIDCGHIIFLESVCRPKFRNAADFALFRTIRVSAPKSKAPSPVLSQLLC